MVFGKFLLDARFPHSGENLLIRADGSLSLCAGMGRPRLQMLLPIERYSRRRVGWFRGRQFLGLIRARAIFHQLSRRRTQDPALKVVGGAKRSTDADENGAVETNSLSTSPNFWLISEAAAGYSATQ
jgi:hypothetical protein